MGKIARKWLKNRIFGPFLPFFGLFSAQFPGEARSHFSAIFARFRAEGPKAGQWGRKSRAMIVSNITNESCDHVRNSLGITTNFWLILTGQACDVAREPEGPKPRKTERNEKVTQSDFSGRPQSDNK